MDMNTMTLPKKGLKTRLYSMDMNKDIVTLPNRAVASLKKIVRHILLSLNYFQKLGRVLRRRRNLQ